MHCLLKMNWAKLPVCTWQKPGGAIALRAPTLDPYKIIIFNNLLFSIAKYIQWFGQLEKNQAKRPLCTWQKPGGAIALRAPTLGQECRQTWLLRKMFRWQCVLSVDLFRTCLHKVMTELIFNFSLHTIHTGVKIILKLLRVHLLFT